MLLRREKIAFTDNAPGAPRVLMEMFREVNVVSMPVNATSTLPSWVKDSF